MGCSCLCEKTTITCQWHSRSHPMEAARHIYQPVLSRTTTIKETALKVKDRPGTQARGVYPNPTGLLCPLFPVPFNKACFGNLVRGLFPSLFVCLTYIPSNPPKALGSLQQHSENIDCRITRCYQSLQQFSFQSQTWTSRVSGPWQSRIQATICLDTALLKMALRSVKKKS